MHRRVTGNLAARPKFPLSSRAAPGPGTGAGALTRDTTPANSFPSRPPYSRNQKGPGLGEDESPRRGRRSCGHSHWTQTPRSAHCPASAPAPHPTPSWHLLRRGKARLRAASGERTLRATHHDSLIFSCLRIRSTFFSRYSDCVRLHLLMSSTNCWDRTPC